MILDREEKILSFGDLPRSWERVRSINEEILAFVAKKNPCFDEGKRLEDAVRVTIKDIYNIANGNRFHSGIALHGGGAPAGGISAEALARFLRSKTDALLAAFTPTALRLRTKMRELANLTRRPLLLHAAPHQKELVGVTPHPVAPIQCPLPAFCLASDGSETMFMSCFNPSPWRGGLYRVRINGEGLKPFGRPATIYSGLYFDEEKGLLYALSYLSQGKLESRLDVFDPFGSFLESKSLTKAIPWLTGAYCLRGNSRHLYVMNPECHFAVAFLPDDSATHEVIDFDAGGLPFWFDVQGDFFITSCGEKHRFSLYDMRTGRVRRFAGYDVLNNAMGTCRKDGRQAYSISQDGVPNQYEPLGHWLTIHDEFLAPLRTYWLGECRILDIHQLAGGKLLALADYSGQVFFLGLSR